MYKAIDDEFVGNRASAGVQPSEKELDLSTNQDREVFTTSLLSKFLGDKKIKELDSITDRIKYKHHLIALSTKELKKQAAKSKKRPEQKQRGEQRKLSKKLRKQLGLGKIDKSQRLDYKSYEKLNEAWLTYASSCLSTCLPKTPGNESGLCEENVLNVVKQMDFHGCKLRVVSSNAKSLIGVNGIVLQDKKNVFYMLGSSDEVKIVPKAGSLFELELMGCRFTLVGSNLVCKPEMRVTKHAKLKTKRDII